MLWITMFSSLPAALLGAEQQEKVEAQHFLPAGSLVPNSNTLSTNI